jgi:hypothetical protein
MDWVQMTLSFLPPPRVVGQVEDYIENGLMDYQMVGSQDRCSECIRGWARALHRVGGHRNHGRVAADGAQHNAALADTGDLNDLTHWLQSEPLEADFEARQLVHMFVVAAGLEGLALAGGFVMVSYSQDWEVEVSF